MRTQPTPLGLESPPGNPRFPLLDPLRGVAAMAVLTFHFSGEEHLHGWVGRVGDHGNVGVALFFLISGFLLYRPVVAARTGDGRLTGIRSFYQRRLLRIVPAYWVTLTVLAAAPGLSHFSTYWPRLYLFGQIYNDHSFFAGLSVAWTLCVEMSFYLLLPVYAGACARLRPLRGSRVGSELCVLAVLGAGSLVAHGTLLHHGHLGLSSSLLGSFHLFAVGMALSLLSTTSGWDRVSEASAWLAPLAFAAGLLLYAGVCVAWSREATSSLNLAYLPIAALLLLPALLDGNSWLSRPLGNPVLAWLGVVSYGVYLWHTAAIDVIGRHTTSHAVAGVLALLATVLIAAISYYVVEAPFLRLKRRSA